MLYSRVFNAEGAITVCRLVKFGSSDTQVSVATAASDRIAGVYLGRGDAVDGQAIEICMLGECTLEVSGTIARGMTLTTDALGKGINAAPAAGANAKTAAMALQSGTNTWIPVFVCPGWTQG